MLCVSLAAPTASLLAQKLDQVENRADMVEIRLDRLQPQEVDGALELLGRCRLPVIATNRPRWEGGGFQGDETQRLAILRRAVESGADFVDIELKAMEKGGGAVTQCCAAAGCRLILSYHDFQGTPSQPELRSIIRRMAAMGPSVAKVVTTARLPQDVRAILAVYCIGDLLPFELVAFAMGRVGAMSRLACLALGAPFTYVAPSPEETTAPGQLDLESVRRIVELTGVDEPVV